MGTRKVFSRRFNLVLTGTFSILAAAAMAATPARAACTPDPAPAGGTVICSGNSSAFAATEDGISVTVSSGATVSGGSGIAILMGGDDQQFLNNGTVVGSPQHWIGVLIAGQRSTGINNGLISGTGSASVSIQRGVQYFENTGQIISTQSAGVDMLDFFTGTFVNSGLVSGGNWGIYAFTSSGGGLRGTDIVNEEGGIIEGVTGLYSTGGHVDVSNAGLIRSTASDGTAVFVGDYSTVTNEETGIITAKGGYGIIAGTGGEGRATFVNRGLIEADNNAVGGHHYTLENHGDISGTVTGTAASIINSGTINGSVTLDALDDMVDNSGVIMGLVSLGDGSDVYRDLGGTVAGSVSLGNGDDYYVVDPDIAPGAIGDGVDPGAGSDGAGVSLDDVRTVTPVLQSGYEAYAIETRTADSAATITTTTPFTSTVALFGYGDFINEGDISTSGDEAIRLVTSSERNGTLLYYYIGAFSETSSLLNKGTIAAEGAEAILAIGAGDDTLFNQGEIIGDISLGDGNDLLMNGGSIDGDIELGAGDDIYVIDIEAGATHSGVADGGEGFDSAGWYTQGVSASTLAPVDDFEGVAVFVDGEDAQFTIEDSTQTGDTFVTLLGNGTVINDDDLSVTGHEELGAERATVTVAGDGLRFQNEADIVGRVGVRLSGNGQVFTNNADLSRQQLPGDNTGIGGFIEDLGLGNTIINNADVISSGFATEAVMIGGDQTYRDEGARPRMEALQLAGEEIPVSTLINNGVLSSGSIGVMSESFAPIEIINNGTISGLYGYVLRSDIDITNHDGGVIGGFEGYLGGLNIEFRPESTLADVEIYDLGAQPENLTIAANILNEEGGTIENGIVIQGVVYDFWAERLATNLRVGAVIDNQAGAVINGDNAGQAIITTVQFTDTSLSTTYPGTVTTFTTINNAGTINGSIEVSEEVYGEIHNSGLIDAPLSGSAVTVADGDLLDNSGEIRGGEFGVYAGTYNVVGNAGTITGETGVFLNIENDFLNTGTIEAKEVGVYARLDNRSDIDDDGNAGVVNEGVIRSDKDGIYAVSGNLMVNRGEINANQYGIYMYSTLFPPSGEALNVIENSGTITGGVAAVFQNNGAFKLVNSGELIGPVAIHGGDNDDEVVNSGTITGDVNLGDLDDLVTLQTGSVVEGDLDAGAGTDRVVSTGNGSMTGSVSGLEFLTVTGGVLQGNFTGDAGVGLMMVEGGTLQVTGSLSTATLGGNGTVHGNVSNGEIVAPGNAIGMLTIDGNYTQTANGALLIELDPDQADGLVVTGTALLDGMVITSVQAGDLDELTGSSYAILTAAGGVSGSLDTSGAVQQGFLTLDIVQSADAVTLTVTDVNVPIGAMAPRSNLIADAIRLKSENALDLPMTPDDPVTGGVVIGAPDTGEGASDARIVMRDVNPGLPPDPGVTTGLDNQQQAMSLDYDSMGEWESSAASFTGTWSEMAPRTPAGALPKTGTAGFEGTTKGELTEGSGAPEAFVVEGKVMLTADFASGLVNADFTGMEKIDANGVASAWVDFRARMSIADGTSEFAGTAGTDDGVWNGEAKGGFFGDEGGMPGYAAGMWSMSSPLGRALGGFTSKRQ